MGLPRLVLIGTLQLEGLVPLPHPRLPLLYKALGAVAGDAARLCLSEAVVDVIPRKHDPPADCVLAGAVELDRLKELVGLAFASPVCASVHEVPRLHRLHEGAVLLVARVQHGRLGGVFRVHHVLREVNLCIPGLFAFAERRLPAGQVSQLRDFLFKYRGEAANLLIEHFSFVKLSKKFILYAQIVARPRSSFLLGPGHLAVNVGVEGLHHIPPSHNLFLAGISRFGRRRIALNFGLKIHYLQDWTIFVLAFSVLTHSGRWIRLSHEIEIIIILFCRPQVCMLMNVRELQKESYSNVLYLRFQYVILLQGKVEIDALTAVAVMTCINIHLSHLLYQSCSKDSDLGEYPKMNIMMILYKNLLERMRILQR